MGPPTEATLADCGGEAAKGAWFVAVDSLGAGACAVAALGKSPRLPVLTNKRHAPSPGLA
jgi:hypothetical protein